MTDRYKPPLDKDNSHHQLITNINRRIERLSPMYSDCCIYTIPEKVRKTHKEAFSPRVVSIGPFYHGKDRKAIEEHKWRYLQGFLRQTDRTLKECIEAIKKWEERARQCYSERIDLSSDDFTTMVLLDGAFIIELFLLHRFADKRAENDFLFENQKQWMLTDLRRDLSLLENQLPFFVLDDLYDFVFKAHSQIGELPPLLKLTYEFFGFEVDAKTEAEKLRNSNVKHLLDAVRLHFLPSVRKELYDGRKKIEVIPSATELQAAGVRFRLERSNCLFDVKFEKGVLRVPCFKLLPATESLIRNLIAFEQSYYRDDSYFIDYVTFMAGLIKTRADAKLLRRKKIIDVDNWLGNEETLVALFNSFSKGTVFWTRNIYFSSLRVKLTVYFRTPFHKLKRNMTRDSSEKRKNDV